MADYEKVLKIVAEQVSKAVEAKTKSLYYDRTYGSVVKGICKNGKYQVIHNGQLYEVKNALGTNLKVGQSVWVKIPCGHFNQMHICGLR